MSWILPLICLGVMLVMMFVMCRGGCGCSCRPRDGSQDTLRRQAED